MTAREAIDRGIRLVRMPIWNEWAYLELPERKSDGTHGPWANFYDPISASVLQDHGGNDEAARQYGRFPLPLLFTIWDTDDAGFEEFTGERMTPDDIRNGRHIRKAQLLE